MTKSVCLARESVTTPTTARTGPINDTAVGISDRPLAVRYRPLDPVLPLVGHDVECVLTLIFDHCDVTR